MKDRYRLLMENLPNTVVLEINGEGKFSYVSPQIEDIFGYTVEQSIGLDALSFVHPDEREKCVAAMTAAVRGELDGVQSLEYRSRHRDGHYIWVSNTGKVVRSGQDITLVSIVQDISERKRVIEELQHARDTLEHAVRLAAEVIEGMT